MNSNFTFEQLTLVLQYDSYGEKKLSDFDRMFIHQNISALVNEKPYQMQTQTYNRVLATIRIINQLKWESPY